jgi:hypothetical protein
MPASISTRRLLASLAVLTFATGPALADELERVEVRGRVVEAAPRYDVHAACDSIDDQLQSALARTWMDESRYGEVKVQLVLSNGHVDAVNAKGVSNAVSRSVKKAVHRLDCAQSNAGTQVFRFSVDFIDPNAPAAPGDTRTAARRGIRISG